MAQIIRSGHLDPIRSTAHEPDKRQCNVRVRLAFPETPLPIIPKVLST